MPQTITPGHPIQPKRDLFDWGNLEWRFDDSLLPGAGMSIAVMTLQAGKATSSHRHPNCSELLYVQQGEVEVTLGGGAFILREADSALVPQGTVHRVTNLGKADAKLVLSFSAGKRIYEEV